MNTGDKVFIFDQKSDLFIKAGEIVLIEPSKALVMIITGQRGARGCIADWFDMDKLHIKRGRRNAS
jgi:hypothetical protein